MNADFTVLASRDQAEPGRRNQPTGGGAAAGEQPSRGSSVGGLRTIWTVRGFLLAQIAIFLALVSIHFGVPIGGYHHRAAGTTESVIAATLAFGFLLTWTPPPWGHRAAAAAQ